MTGKNCFPACGNGIGSTRSSYVSLVLMKLREPDTLGRWSDVFYKGNIFSEEGGYAERPNMRSHKLCPLYNWGNHQEYPVPFNIGYGVLLESSRRF